MIRSNPRRLGKVRMKCGCLIAPLVIFGLLVAFYQITKPKWNVRKVERLLQSEVELGWDRRRIDAWLDQQQFAHEFLEDVRSHQYGSRTVAEMAGLSDREMSGMVIATIPNADLNSFFGGDIRIYFFFDRQGGLVKYLIVPWEIAL